MHYMTHVDEDILEDSVHLLISYNISFSSDFVGDVILSQPSESGSYTMGWVLGCFPSTPIP
jgi:hypothetical protein